MTKQEFIFSNRPTCKFARHFAFWVLFSIHILVFRYYLYDLKYLLDPRTYFIRLHNMMLFLPVSFFYAYFAMYYLLPHFILKGRYIPLMLIVFSMSVVLLILSYLISSYFHIQLAWDLPLERQPLVRQLDFTVSNGLVYPLTVSTFAIGIKMSKGWYLKQKENEQLLEQKIKKEIQLLKSQIHPRFIFHSLSAVYNDTLTGFEKSSSMLLKLSDLLSYLLYESNEDTVPLEKELNMMEDYLGLEKLCYGDSLKLSIHKVSKPVDQLIAPVLLLPVLECVFEQDVISKKRPLALELYARLEESDFYFTLVLQSEPPLKEEQFYNNERILQVQRRLAALYEGRHEFKVFSEEYGLTISLIISLGNKTGKEVINKNQITAIL